MGHIDNTQISKKKKYARKFSPSNYETELQCGWNIIHEKSKINFTVIDIDPHVLKENKRHVLGALHLK